MTHCFHSAKPRTVWGISHPFKFGTWLSVAAFLFVTVTGCRSAFITANVYNDTAASLPVLEVDYPSASFGVSPLAAHATFHYRFKVQGSGPLKIQFTDSAGKNHTATGPELREGEEGLLNITVDSADRVTWEPKVTLRQ